MRTPIRVYAESLHWQFLYIQKNYTPQWLLLRDDTQQDALLSPKSKKICAELTFNAYIPLSFYFFVI